jgi:hypothetical protein
MALIGESDLEVGEKGKKRAACIWALKHIKKRREGGTYKVFAGLSMRPVCVFMQFRGQVH